MSGWRVEIERAETYTVEVEADTEDEARERAAEAPEPDDFDRTHWRTGYAERITEGA